MLITDSSISVGHSWVYLVLHIYREYNHCANLKKKMKKTQPISRHLVAQDDVLNQQG